jgi:hypothetical protein
MLGPCASITASATVAEPISQRWWAVNLDAAHRSHGSRVLLSSGLFGLVILVVGCGEIERDSDASGFAGATAFAPADGAGVDGKTPPGSGAASNGNTLADGSASFEGGASATGAGSGAKLTLQPIPGTANGVVVLAWNDLGMHSLNPTYDVGVLMPPYNTLWAQVIRRGSPPRVSTQELTVEYALIDNTFSSGKTDPLGAEFAKFWVNAPILFGVTLPPDQGLNLITRALHHGLSGQMEVAGDHFEVNGIPVVPVDDGGHWNPYQVAEITVKDAAGATLATTLATVPTSDEMDCSRCHAENGAATVNLGGGEANVFRNLLRAHDAAHRTTLLAEQPVLCAKCHGSPVLGTNGPGSAGEYLSQAVHGAHAPRGASCYSCHPGERTQSSRSLAHRGMTGDGNCTTCHGTLAEVAGTIARGARVPWLDEPKCVTCHPGVLEVDTGNGLYRNAKGHRRVYCAGCHGSPHAQIPSAQESDNVQAVRLQGADKSLGSCGVCHASSRGEGSQNFAKAHGNPDGEPTACHVCHTEVSAAVTSWPHAFQWQAR